MVVYRARESKNVAYVLSETWAKEEKKERRKNEI
jgi:hypothetical protein